MSSPLNRVLGIMVCADQGKWPPFSDRGFFRRLSKAGGKQGIEVVVFDPLSTDWSASRIIGYCYSHESGRWLKVNRPIPTVIFDRCFYRGRSHYIRYKAAARRLQKLRQVRFLAASLSGKWQVAEWLNKYGAFQPHMPETQMLHTVNQVSEWLQLEQACILKPNAGSHGKRIVRVSKLPDGRYELIGRDVRNELLHAAFDSERQLLRWLERFIGSKRFLLQASLALHTESGRAFDVRSLMQKNGRGNWSLTGMAVRLGRPGSLTANLHGGGTVSPAETFLQEHYEPEQAAAILRQLTHLSQSIPPVLEQHSGRLVELGIDFGVDNCGHVWILEVNSKPGRSIFSKLHDARKSTASVNHLIQYARYLLDRQLGGLTR